RRCPRLTSDALQHVEQDEDECEAGDRDRNCCEVEHQRWLPRYDMASLRRCDCARHSVAWPFRVVSPGTGRLRSLQAVKTPCVLAGTDSAASCIQTTLDRHG